jgi:hypothetical protein
MPRKPKQTVAMSSEPTLSVLRTLSYQLNEDRDEIGRYLADCLIELFERENDPAVTKSIVSYLEDHNLWHGEFDAWPP